MGARRAGGSDKAMSFELNPGETADLQEGDWRVNARKVRTGESDKGAWDRFREADLWLVPEQDHVYEAPEVQTFLFTVR